MISLHSPGRELVMKDAVARGITAFHALQNKERCSKKLD
jgi:hypothetical protein